VTAAFRFDCVFYYSADLDRSIRFYTEVLGFRFLSRDAVARLTIDGVLFELVPSPEEHAFSAKGNARLCLRVADVAAALMELETKGVRVHAPEDKGAGVLGRIHDPDGNEICLWQDRKAR
jgi:catechol 2,3-dioxygenase-like lactoylglutathione lyase family enzyme